MRYGCVPYRIVSGMYVYVCARRSRSLLQDAAAALQQPKEVSKKE